MRPLCSKETPRLARGHTATAALRIHRWCLENLEKQTRALQIPHGFSFSGQHRDRPRARCALVNRCFCLHTSVHVPGGGDVRGAHAGLAVSVHPAMRSPLLCALRGAQPLSCAPARLRNAPPHPGDRGGEERSNAAESQTAGRCGLSQWHSGGFSIAPPPSSLEYFPPFTFHV